jgi:hypothetical protein
MPARRLGILQTTVASMKKLTDNGAVPSGLSDQELQRLAEYFSILGRLVASTQQLERPRRRRRHSQSDDFCRTEESGVGQRSKSVISDRQPRCR